MKVIFLDVDGVLNSADYYASLEDTHGYDKDIDIEKVKLLKEIVDATGAKIVLSSTWRMLREIDNSPALTMYIHLDRVLAENGMFIEGFTPVIGNNRPLEIRNWIVDHEDDIESFISLDDDFVDEEYELAGLIGCLVKTSYWRSPGGLQPEHVEKAIKILNGE